MNGTIIAGAQRAQGRGRAGYAQHPPEPRAGKSPLYCLCTSAWSPFLTARGCLPTIPQPCGFDFLSVCVLSRDPSKISPQPIRSLSPVLPCPQVSLLPQSEVWQLQLGALTPPLLSYWDTKVLGAGRGAWARDWLCDPERLCVSGTQISLL